MIKNFLYSLFLHFLLLATIYVNFNLKNLDEKKSNEVAVSLVILNGDQGLNKSEIPNQKEVEKEIAIPKPEPAEIPQEPESPKQSVKNQVKEPPKKVAKAKPTKTVPKTLPPKEKSQDFKQEEKTENVKKEVDKIKDDTEENKNQEQEQKNTSEPKKDSGLKKKSDQEQERKEASDKKSQAIENSSQTANSIETLNLSVREKFNIQSQLKRCYNRAIEENKSASSKIKISIKVQLNREGFIESDLDDIVDDERYNDAKESGYKTLVDNVRRAIDICSPLRNLPSDKYYVWKEVMLEFGGDEDVVK